MSTLDVRIEQVSGRISLLVFANLMSGWRRIGDNFGFYGFAHKEYQGSDLVTVRIWLSEHPPQLHRTEDGLPLDLQSMGSSPSKALSFRLFHGLLSLGTSMSTVINSRLSTGEPGICEDAIPVAHYGSVDYWLKFYAVLNEEPSGTRDWIEYGLSADKGEISRTHQIHEVPTSYIEERLKDLSFTVEGLEGRVGALEADLWGDRAKQAGDLEKVAKELGERWSQQFQEQAEAAVASLREELEDSGRVVEETKQQLAGLVEAKLASLGQATRDEYAQQLAQAFREQAQEMQAAADAEVKSIKRAAEEAVARLRGAEQQKESSSLARAGAVEERLTQVSLAVEALEGRMGTLAEEFRGRIEDSLQAFQGKGVRQAEDLEKIAQELRERWSQQFQEQAEAAAARLREELNKSGRVVEEHTGQLSRLAEAKLASLSQVVANAVADFEAEQRSLKSQYETSRREFENHLARRWTKLPPTSSEHGNRLWRRGKVAISGLAVVIFLIIIVTTSGIYLLTPPPVKLQLKAEVPSDFVEQDPTWDATRRVLEEKVAGAYWQVAVLRLQETYPFGSELPADPPDAFQVDKELAPTGGAEALAETRDLYWEKLRVAWAQRENWVESHEENTSWTSRLRHLWR